MLPIKFICQAFIILIICTQSYITAETCNIDLTNLLKGRSSDITFLNNEFCSFDYAYPTINNTIEVDEGDSIQIYCPGETSYCASYSLNPGIVMYNNETIGESEILSLFCKSNKKFDYNGTTVDLSKFSCKNKPGAIMHEEERNRRDCKCGRYFKIGYEILDDDFITTLDLCHDDIKVNTIWTHTIVQPTLYASRKINIHKVTDNYKHGELFEDLNMTKIYNPASVYNSARNILKNRTVVNKYLSTKAAPRKRLLKGRLITGYENLYNTEHVSTFFFANVLPIWETIRGGHWKEIANYAAFMSQVQRRPLDVWAGGLDVLKLKGKEIYLHNKTQVPVPKILFKAVVDQVANLAIVFIVINNPYVTSEEIEEYRVCDIIDSSIIDFPDQYNATSGYMYTCKLSNFYNNNRKKLGLKSFLAFENYGTFDITNGFYHQKYTPSSPSENLSPDEMVNYEVIVI